MKQKNWKEKKPKINCAYSEIHDKGWTTKSFECLKETKSQEFLYSYKFFFFFILSKTTELIYKTKQKGRKKLRYDSKAKK